MSHAPSSTEATSVEPSTAGSPPAAPPESNRSLTQELAFFTERFGHLMSRLILTLLYFLLVTPAGIFVSLFGDPLKIRRWPGSSWNPWGHANETVEQARRQD